MSTTIASLPWFGGELSSVDPSDSTVGEVTSAGTYITTANGPNGQSWARCAVAVVGGSSAYFTTPNFPTGASTFWDHWAGIPGQPGQGTHYNGQIITQYFNGATEVARITADRVVSSTNTYYFYTLQNGVMTLCGSFTCPEAVQIFDIQFVSNSTSGQLVAYLNGSQRFATAANLNHSAWNGITQIKRLGVTFSPGVNNNTYWSEMICDTTSTIGRRLYTVRIDTISGTNAGFTSGAVTDINETVLNDTTYIASGTAAQIDTFYMNGNNLGSFSILAKGVAARCLTQVGAPQNLQLAVRSGSTNYFSSTIAVGPGFQSFFNSWTTDPNTSAAWANGASSTEFGVKSIT